MNILRYHRHVVGHDSIASTRAIIFLIGLLLSSSLQTTLAIEKEFLPTKENPLTIDLKNQRILIYAEVNKKDSQKTSTHLGVVFKDGRLAEKALFKAYANPLEFHDALLKIGAKPGNNLTENSGDYYVSGDRLYVTVMWPHLNKEFPLKDILADSGGKGFEIRFGGNRSASAKENSGCITCLESCWVGITSNAAYPVTSTLRRLFSPSSQFSIDGKVLPADGGNPVILIYTHSCPKYYAPPL